MLSWPTLYSLPAALVSNLLELTAASIPNPDAENALTAAPQNSPHARYVESDAIDATMDPKQVPPRDAGPASSRPAASRSWPDVDLNVAPLAKARRELLTDLARCDFQYKRVNVPSAFCSAIAESPIIDTLLNIISYDDEATRARHLELNRITASSVKRRTPGLPESSPRSPTRGPWRWTC